MKYFLAICSLIHISLFGYQYTLSIGAMFKNEAPWLKEWIEYHRVIGVEHFYLYNNDSSDEFRAVLDPYIQQGIVDLIQWESIPEHWRDKNPIDWTHDPATWIVHWVGYQCGAYDDCMQRSIGVSKWVAIVDIDEFIFPAKGPGEGTGYFKELLETLPFQVGSLALLSTNFGTSRVERILDGALMIESLVRRGPEPDMSQSFVLVNGSVANNGTTKCLYRPEAARSCYAHYGGLHEGFERRNLSPRDVRLNHYYTRDREDCRKRRIGQLDVCERYLNAVFDDSMLPFAPLVKKAMEK